MRKSQRDNYQALRDENLHSLIAKIFEYRALVIVPLILIITTFLLYFPIQAWRVWSLVLYLSAIVLVGVPILTRVSQKAYGLSFFMYFLYVVLWVHSGLVLLTGGLDSPLIPLLLIVPAITGVLWEERYRAYLSPAMVTLIVSIMGLLQWLGILPNVQGLSPSPISGVALLLKGFFVVMLSWFITIFSVSLASRYRSIAIHLEETQKMILESHQERLRSLETLSRRVAHEVKNPLSAIKGLTQLLQRKGDETGHLKVIIGEINRLQDILEGFLTFSKPMEDLQITAFSLNALLNDLLRILDAKFKTEGIHSSFTNAEESFQLSGDATRLKQVFLNLFLNSIEAMEQTQGTKRLILSTKEQEGGFLIQLRDNGPGFEQQLQHQAFSQALQPEVTTKPKGSGLGLPISLSIIKAHAGQLELSDHPDGGALVKVWLPKSPPQQGAGVVLDPE